MQSTAGEGQTAALVSFCDRYSARYPEFIHDVGEQTKLPCSLVHWLPVAPATVFKVGEPPIEAGAQASNTYLWVIDDNGIPYVLEALIRISNERRIPKHTNLTAGDPAYIDGELWFSSSTSLYLSGASGRYPPESAEHLEDAVGVFSDFGYSVTSVGWDSDMDQAKRFQA